MKLSKWHRNEDGKIVVPGPGLYEMPAAAYHADPCPEISLSCSGVKNLVTVFGTRLVGCPAKFKHLLTNPQPYKDVWDFGSVAHRVLLGKGEEIKIIEMDNYKTKSAKLQRDAARMAGQIPILRHKYDEIEVMIREVLKNPEAQVLFKNGDAERVLIHQCPDTGIWMRSMVDWSHSAQLLVDYKTCQSAHPSAVEKAITDYGYYIQDPFYCEVAQGIGLLDDPAFVFYFQEKTEPYLTLPVQLDPEARGLGKCVIAHAKEVLRGCLDTDKWPGYQEKGIYQSGMTYWESKRLHEAIDRGELTDVE